MFIKLFTLCLLFLFSAFAAPDALAQTCSPAPVGLVSWWQGNGDALDSRSGNNGTLTNGATFAAGQVGQAFSLDGIDDFIDIPNGASLNNLTTHATFEAWIQPQANGQQFIFAHRTPGFLESFSVRTFDTGELSLLVAVNGGTVVEFQTNPGVIQLSQMQHIAVTVNTTNTTAQAFVNGVPVTFPQTSGGSLGGSSLNAVSNNFIGQRQAGQFFFKGLIDEASVYSSELTQAQVQAIFNAGTAGKCKPTATVAPSGLVGFWSGDGNTNDIAGMNNGIFQDNANFGVGKIGQAFNFDGTDDRIEIPNNAALSPATISLEAWVRPTSINVGSRVISQDISSVSCLNPVVVYSLETRGEFGGKATFFYATTDNVLHVLQGTTSIPLNVFSHISATYDGTTAKIYVNGVLENSQSVSGSMRSSTAPTIIGNADTACRASAGNVQGFNGIIDEPSIYDRALTQDEITSIVNAGIAGKLKDNATPTGSNVAVSTKSDGTVTFPNVSTAGSTEQIPLDLSLFPALPIGSTTAGLTYDIATTAVFTGSPQVCFNLPSITDSTIFNNLRIAHLESNSWINRTDLVSINFATKTICTVGLTSLSPFAIINGFGPSAANAAISGRVRTSNGRGITNAFVSLTDMRGAIHQARTSSFGYYRFDMLPIGETYVLNVASKRYTFADPTRVISLNNDLTDEDFVTEGKY